MLWRGMFLKNLDFIDFIVRYFNSFRNNHFRHLPFRIIAVNGFC
jgi:hypothetical protein